MSINSVNPSFSFFRKTTLGVVDTRCLKTGSSQTLICFNYFLSGVSLNPKMVDCAMISTFFEDDELQWRINDRPVGVAGFHLHRFGVKQFCIELNSFIKIVNIESKL